MRRSRRGLCREDGYALVATLTIGAIMFLLAAVIFGRNISDFNQVGHDRRREQAIHAADGGLDHALYRVDVDHSWNTSEILAGQSFVSDRAERDWAIQQAQDNAATRSPEGDWAVVRPADAQVIYAVGYIPSRTEPRNIRVIRADYDFAPFRPDYAILTGGDLLIPGNPVVAGSLANVHANKNVVISGNPNIAGKATASGDYSQSGNPVLGQGWEESVPLVAIPNINPREHYLKSHYDLCPNGTVRAGPSYIDTNGASAPNPNGSSTPCAGDQLAVATSNEYRGWKKSGDDSLQLAKWDYGGSTAYDGVYYVYQGSAKVGGNPGENAAPWNVTIIAEATATGPEPTHCPHRGGDIEVSGNPKMHAHSHASPLLFIAGRDLKVNGNPQSGGPGYSGVFAAHEQAQLSGNPVVVGAVISNSSCNTSGSPIPNTGIETNGNPSITYDGLDIPFGETIRVTRWLEL